MIRVLAGLAVLITLWPIAVAGHAMPNSTVVLTMERGGAQAQLLIPISELEAALRRDLSTMGQIVAAQPLLEAYLRTHVALGSSEGALWAMSVARMAVGTDDHVSLQVTLRFSSPAPAQHLRLEYDAVSREIASHYVLVYVRDREGLRALGRLQSPARNLVFARDHDAE